jgi:hypothetical protein
MISAKEEGSGIATTETWMASMPNRVSPDGAGTKD